MQRSLERDPGAKTGDGQKFSGHLREIQEQRLGHLSEIQEQRLERDLSEIQEQRLERDRSAAVT